jgi:nucleotide-binding universal stress UspA family protein
VSAPQTDLRIKLRNILFTVDFSPASVQAIPYVTAFAKWFDSRVFVAHVVPPETPLGIPMDVAPVDMELNWIHAQRKLDTFNRDHDFAGVKHDSILQQGELWDVLSDLIESEGIDLLVLGTHGRQGLRKLVMGSMAEQIFRRAPCPVLTVGPRVNHPDIEFQNLQTILFATDFSQGSLHALPYALSLAEENQSRLILLHVMPLTPIQYADEIRANTEQKLWQLLPTDAAAWCKPEFVSLSDYPGEGILNVAEDRNVDLIVMGVHKPAAPRTTAHLPWTIASEVVSRAHCPVLTVRD